MSIKTGVGRDEVGAWWAMCDHADHQWLEQHDLEHLAVRALGEHQRGCLYHALRTELPENDDLHPVSLLGTWARMLSEDYDLECPDLLDLGACAAFLDRVLNRVAQDPEQDFPLLRREMIRCRSHLESVLRDSREPERGAPCPECRTEEHVVRLVREYAHWCEDDDCGRIHVTTDELDRWVCPRNRAHWWTPAQYRNYLEERTGA